MTDNEERTFDLLNQITSRKELIDLDIESYNERLQSFKPWTYCAKPASLSPILCARFGWKNSARDMLCCKSCNAVLAIKFRTELSWKGREDLTKMYFVQLATAHADHCPFGIDAKQHLLLKEDNDTDKIHTEKNDTTLHKNDIDINNELIVPSYLVPIVPPELMELIDCSVSDVARNIFQKRVQSFIHQISSSECNKLPQLKHSNDFWDYIISKQSNSNNNDNSDHNTMSEILHMDLDESAILLSLTGWEVIEQPNNNTHNNLLQSTISAAGDKDTVNHLLLGCPLCMSQINLTVAAPSSASFSLNHPEAETDDEARVSRPSKRIKSEKAVNPIISHRYYCPFVCGFYRNSYKNGLVPTEPIWKLLFSKLCPRNNSKVGDYDSSQPSTVLGGDDQTVVKLQKILQSGLSQQQTLVKLK